MITYDHFYTISREYAAFILSRAMNVSKWTSLTLNLNVLMVISFFFFFFFLTMVCILEMSTYKLHINISVFYTHYCFVCI